MNNQQLTTLTGLVGVQAAGVTIDHDLSTLIIQAVIAVLTLLKLYNDKKQPRKEAE